MEKIYIAGHDPGEVEICIIVTGRPPDFKSLTEGAIFYQDEAECLYCALSRSLPQGTLHQLLIEMLKGHQNLIKTGVIHE